MVLSKQASSERQGIFPKRSKMKKMLLIISLVLAALLLSPSSIAARSMGVKGGGSGTGNRPPAAVPCRPGTNLSNCIPKPPKKCNHPFQKDCP
ncbi:hypothetical protein COLO4_16215 [Corchorus olitorius]|uniref:Uncharacterized protein n=1 Tax=Corchorus olitorius TaxID=93759 RepID=A0A1R3JIN1_9ROSI|nr:hypothetical protein COLO4_16215 [Corchorus olitorius]